MRKILTFMEFVKEQSSREDAVGQLCRLASDECVGPRKKEVFEHWAVYLNGLAETHGLENADEQFQLEFIRYVVQWYRQKQNELRKNESGCS